MTMPNSHPPAPQENEAVPPGMQLELPGMVTVAPMSDETGPLEAALIDQVRAGRAGGWIGDAHAATVALAQKAAHQLDRMGANTKAYGMAQMVTAYKTVLELLPTPDVEVSDEWTELVDALKGDEGP